MTDERTRTLLGWLGKIVAVTTTNVGGGVVTAPVQQGVVKQGDGKDIPVYLLGATVLGGSYMGKVISVMRRYAEDTDKLIVAPVGQEMYEPWIRADIEQEEDMEQCRLFCLYEKSCGVIPYRVRDGKIEYLALFQSGSSTWSFPKGHMEYGETEEQTALREIFEETSLKVSLDTSFRNEYRYLVDGYIHKTVLYFLASYNDGAFRPQPGEVFGIWLLPYEDALEKLDYEQDRSVLRMAERKLALEEQKNNS